jgi:hypothetical protein
VLCVCVCLCGVCVSGIGACEFMCVCMRACDYFCVCALVLVCVSEGKFL